MATDIINGASKSTLHESNVHRFTVDAYHRMVESGILNENDRVQLLEGVIVQMNPIGSRHRVVVTLLNELLIGMVPSGWHVGCQQPVRLATSEPEPDLSVVRGKVRDYVDRIPAAADVPLVIEVADTSLELDKTDKARIYAAAGIPEYWIVDLDSSTVQILREPGTQDAAKPAAYRSVQTLKRDQQVAVTLDGNPVGELAVSDFLP